MSFLRVGSTRPIVSQKRDVWRSFVFLFTATLQKRRSSFELWALKQLFGNVTPSGIGCTSWKCNLRKVIWKESIVELCNRMLQKWFSNEGADILADKAISDPKVGKTWRKRTSRAVFTWKKPWHEAGNVSYRDRHLTFHNTVRDAIRTWRAAENDSEMPKHQEELKGAWPWDK